MKKYFYSHIVETSSISLALGNLDMTAEERSHLLSLVESNIHHAILDTILSELTPEDKKKFLEHLSAEDHERIWKFLNEKVEVSLVLDTGASIMMLRKDVVEKLGMDLDNVKPDMQAQLADGRKVDAKHIILESVKVQDSQAQNVDAAVLLDEAGITFGDGLLGMSFLNRFNFKVDQKEKKLILEKL